MNYYDDDPKKGGKRISFWRYLQISGMLNDFKKAGYTINPTHNCEMLIPVRNAIFEKVKGQFIDERSLNELKTTNYDLSQLYSLWLEKELEVIKGWLSKIYPNGDKKKVMHSISEQLEISKYKKYVIDEITKINNTPPTIETKKGQAKPQTFKELFYDKDLCKPCIDILRKADPPLIDAECNYIGRSKGAFCVWIEEMQRQGIIQRYPDRKIYANLLPTIINGFSINESMFGKIQKRAEEIYKKDFKIMISEIKLSQNSQKAKLGK